MDLEDYSEAKFSQIEKEYRAYLRNIGVEPKIFIPIAAKHGDNIAALSKNMPWWQGPTVLEALDDQRLQQAAHHHGAAVIPPILVSPVDLVDDPLDVVDAVVAAVLVGAHDPLPSVGPGTVEAGRRSLART